MCKPDDSDNDKTDAEMPTAPRAAPEHDLISRTLKQLYANVLNEPMPARFEILLKDLGKLEKEK